MTTLTPAWWRFLLDQFELRMMQAEFGEAGTVLPSSSRNQSE
ncbi:hypothetical protein [Rheinheimera sp. 4Y26]|nr:hypothetical protein [Rheinheimera sp. 4Y26]MCT6699795.1 hypothetical protein [Rheinheimera sp. 4Y26]